MAQDLILHGVPDRIRLDGWWLETTETPEPDIAPPMRANGSLMASLRMRQVIPLLGALVVLADWLFWHQPVGLSLAIFAVVVSAAILAVKPERPSLRSWGLTMGFALLCNLPVVIELQFLSLLFSLGGLITLAAWAFAGSSLTTGLILRMALRLPAFGLVHLVKDTADALPPATYSSRLRHMAATLLLPLLMGAVFMGLLANANPVLQAALDSIDLRHLLRAEFWTRFLFWGCVASLLWPLLNLSESWIGAQARPARATKAGPHRSSFLINPLSVRNSLWLFNLMFGVQTLMDLSILTGRVLLPEGMSYASYAHRGAYPLVATALLAGLFTLLTRNMIGQDKVLRSLVYLWLAQNMILVATAAIRLQHYVEAYALTYLRVAAFIWMALVLTGLLLTIWQIHRGFGTSWLLRRCLAALAITLYLSSLTNFADIVARYNLTHGSALRGPDTYYICSLGPGAYRAILDHEANTGQHICTRMIERDLERISIQNWREWGYRMWRLEAYDRAQN